MIGATYRSTAVQAILGPSRSPLIPAVLWVGWLDSDGDLIAMSGLSVTHDVWGPSGDGVVNTITIDAGVAGTGWSIAAVGLFDAATGGALVVAASAPAVLTPTEGEALTFAPGELVFTVAP